MKATPIEKLSVTACKIPTDQPESDGTYEWDSTTIVIVEAEAGGKRSLGYSYADDATAKLIESKLQDVVLGRDAFSVNGAFVAMVGVDPQSGPTRHRVDGDLGGGQRALGFEGAAARFAARATARRGARGVADLRQRRVHFVLRGANCRSNSAVGSSREFRA